MFFTLIAFSVPFLDFCRPSVFLFLLFGLLNVNALKPFRSIGHFVDCAFVSVAIRCYSIAVERG